MALGKRKPKQNSLWVDARHLQAHPAHPFYRRLNEILERAQFDRYVERICRKYYAPIMGRPSLPPGVYFRCFLVGYFEGIDSERGIAYRISDSLSLREFLGLSLEEPTPAERQRWDRRRKKSLSNREWMNPHDAEARITKLKDGRTHLAYKAEHAVDLDTGAVVALTVQPADCGDTASLRATLAEAGSVVTEMAGQAAEANAVGPLKAVSEVGVERVVADKGYHSKQLLQELAEVGVRTLIAEPERKRPRWAGQRAAQAAVYANRRRLKTPSGQVLMRRRGVLIERTFAHLYDTGGLRRVHLRGKDNIAKRLLIHAAAFNLSLILRQPLGVGTAR